jgi:hypothetical protein
MYHNFSGLAKEFPRINPLPSAGAMFNNELMLVCFDLDV